MSDATITGIFYALKEPFPQESVHWRIGATNGRKKQQGWGWETEPTKGMPLAYLTARDVMDRLDEVVGPENWSDSYTETPSGRVICTIGIRMGSLVVSKSDGAGDTGTEGEKGAISDAFKRAAVKFGIGRYLYKLDDKWVSVECKGKSVFIKGSPPKLPAFALPGGQKETEPKTKAEPVKDGSEDVGENVVDFEKAKILKAFTELRDRGVKVMGLDEYIKRAEFIVAEGYGGGDWTSIEDLDVLRKLYGELESMINQYQDRR